MQKLGDISPISKKKVTSPTFSQLYDPYYSDLPTWREYYTSTKRELQCDYCDAFDVPTKSPKKDEQDMVSMHVSQAK
jgi:hypothetical protein